MSLDQQPAAGRPALASLISMKDLCDTLKASDEWLLLSPKGLVFKGKDPLVLAAQATYKPPSIGDIDIARNLKP